MMRALMGKTKHRVEDSIPLRAVTTAMALSGIAAALNLTDSPAWLAVCSLLGCVLGSYLSYRRRNSNNFIVKIWISIGILIVLGVFFNELISLANANVADSRIPLTKLLMALMALHCFDLPRRRDLSLSALVGVTLMTSASTLSRDLSFLGFLAVFMILSVAMFQLDCVSRSKNRGKMRLRQSEADAAYLALGAQKQNGLKQNLNALLKSIFGNNLRASLRQTALISSIVIGVTLGCFAFLPRIQLNVLKQLRFSGTMPFQFQMNFMTQQMSQLLSPDGSVKPRGNSYFGFAEELDTNHRGELGKDVVLRVSSNNGTYLRGMAYDTFDGLVWTMSKPKKTTEIVARTGNIFDFAFEESSRVRYKPISQVVYVEQDSSNIVVCASVPYQIYFPSQNLLVDSYNSIRSPVGMQKDMVYTVFSQVPMFDYQLLRNLPEPEKPREGFIQKHSNYLQLPEKLSPRVAALSARIAGKGSTFLRAERLSKYLQSHYDYDLDIPPTPAGSDSVSDFLLRTHTGFCEHFASALTVMCRTQGIPARLVTGYAPGNFNPFTGLWEVRLAEAHSWTEIYIRKIGWVPLDATPCGMDVYEPQEAASLFSYIGNLLEPLWKSFINSPFCAWLESAFKFVFAKVAAVSFSGAKYLMPTLAVSVVLAALLTVMRIFKFGWSFPFAWGRGGGKPGDERQQILQEASKEFLAVSKSLAGLGIERKPYETSEDLLTRVKEKLLDGRNDTDEFVSTLSNFMDEYSSLRFGSAGESERLKRLSQSVDKMSEELAEKRKTELVFK